MVYKNMLLSIIEYGNIFLSASSVDNRKRLQTLQNKGLRCALNESLGSATTDELHSKAGLLRLKYRREQHLLNFMFDLSNNTALLKNKTLSQVQTHSSCKKLFKIKKPRTEKYKKSMVYKGKTKWNGLPVSLHQATSKHAYRLLVQNWIVARSRSVPETGTNSLTVHN